MELAPAGELFVGSSSEFTVLASRDGSLRALYLWVESRAYDVTELLGKRCTLGLAGMAVDVGFWLEDSVVVDFGVVDSYEEYVGFLQRMGFDRLRGKTVLAAYSGGKDSNAVVYLLSRLSESVGFEFRAVYVHMPFLEPEKNLDVVERLSKRLGVDVEVLEPPRKIVLRYLLREGLPFRGFRWCTYLKTRPMREYAKKRGVKVLAVGDRVWEASRRAARLLEALEKGRLVRKGFAYPAALLTLLDVVGLCRELGLVHPSYLRGAARVSCLYCPYKAAYELKLGEEVEDEGLIEEVLRREWRKWYSSYVNFEEFVSENLWRYSPRTAKILADLKRALERLSALFGLRELRAEDAARMHSQVWTSPTSKRIIDRSHALEAVRSLARSSERRSCVRIVRAL